MKGGAADDLELLAEAEALLGRAHSPYSGVAVAAVVEASDGRRFGGVNVENTSLGLTICAERNALVAAVAAGAAGRAAPAGVSITRIVFTTNNPAITTPCGACCQVISELAGEARILYGREGRLVKAWNRVSDLLPEAVDSTWKTGRP